MPMSGSLWDTRTLRSIVADWYGLLAHQMPMRIETREEEVEAFEREHPEVPMVLWEFVNHPIRQVLMWFRRSDVDIVVWNEPSQSMKLVQDLCFKDAYADDKAWRQAILEVLKDESKKVWFVFHDS